MNKFFEAVKEYFVTSYWKVSDAVVYVLTLGFVNLAIARTEKTVNEILDSVAVSNSKYNWDETDIKGENTVLPKPTLDDELAEFYGVDLDPVPESKPKKPRKPRAKKVKKEETEITVIPDIRPPRTRKHSKK